MTRRTAGVRVFGSAMAIAIGTTVPAWAHGTTERVSVGLGGVQSNDFSSDPAISADGRFVAFDSYATNLVPGDTNDAPDVFIRDRQTGTTRRVSLGPNGVHGDDRSFGGALSADGRFVAFYSYATNLVPGDTNKWADVFVHDRQTGITQRVNLGPGGAQANNYSVGPVISADGRFIAFESFASNLVPDDTNDASDVFIRDRQKGTTRRVSLGPGGIQGNSGSYDLALSADGRFVAFQSEASNLVPGDTNGAQDVFVRDRQTATTKRVSLGKGSVQANDYSSVPAISADGRFVAFFSGASNLVPGDTNGTSDVFIRDRQKGTTQRVSLGPDEVQANGYSQFPAISANGRFVTFESKASNLVLGDANKLADVFIRDRQKGTTRRVSLGPDGVQANGNNVGPAISADGRFIAFWSSASNLVPGDTNGAFDVFVRILAP